MEEISSNLQEIIKLIEDDYQYIFERNKKISLMPQQKLEHMKNNLTKLKESRIILKQQASSFITQSVEQSKIYTSIRNPEHSFQGDPQQIKLKKLQEDILRNIHQIYNENQKSKKQIHRLQLKNKIIKTKLKIKKNKLIQMVQILKNKQINLKQAQTQTLEVLKIQITHAYTSNNSLRKPNKKSTNYLNSIEKNEKIIKSKDLPPRSQRKDHSVNISRQLRKQSANNIFKDGQKLPQINLQNKQSDFFNNQYIRMRPQNFLNCQASIRSKKKILK